ncbi:MAG: hypothetical protein GY830_09415 [Bacteroidetes bacterium]|nr:hypothetical protein [Bacteroidota bacterium]
MKTINFRISKIFECLRRFVFNFCQFFILIHILSCDPEHNPKRDKEEFIYFNDRISRKFTEFFSAPISNTEINVLDPEDGLEKLLNSQGTQFLLNSLYENTQKNIDNRVSEKTINDYLIKEIDKEFKKCKMQKLSDLGENIDLTKEEFDEAVEMSKRLTREIIIAKAKTKKNLTKKDFRNIIKEYKNIQSEKGDPLDNLMQVIEALTEEGICLLDILFQVPGLKKKMEKSSNEIVKAIGDDYDEYIKTFPSLIKLVTAKILGGSGLGNKIPKSKPEFNLPIRYQVGNNYSYPKFLYDLNLNKNQKHNIFSKYVEPIYNKSLSKFKNCPYQRIEIINNQNYYSPSWYGTDKNLLNNDTSPLVGDNKKYKRRSLDWVKKLLLYQGFTDNQPSIWGQKAKLFDNKQCGINALLKSLAMAINRNDQEQKLLDESFVYQVQDDYLGATNDIDWKKYLVNLIFGDKKSYNELNNLEKKNINILNPLIKSCMEKGILLEVGLLPKNIVARYQSLGARYYYADTFPEINRLMKNCLANGKIPFPLVYHETGGMHYFDLVHFESSEYQVDDSDLTLGPISVRDLEKHMTYKEKSITSMIKGKNMNLKNNSNNKGTLYLNKLSKFSTQKKIKILLGEEKENVLVSITKKIIQDQTGGAGENDVVKYCFVVIE